MPCCSGVVRANSWAMMVGIDGTPLVAVDGMSLVQSVTDTHQKSPLPIAATTQPALNRQFGALCYDIRGDNQRRAGIHRRGHHGEGIQ
jgi:hypothetical protein